MQRRWKITGFMALVLFLLFSLCILGVLLTGADVYGRITEKDRTAYDRRTAVQYLTTKIRQSDAHGNLAVTELDGIPALQLQEQVGDRVYVTHIYCAEGYIWELYAQQGSGLSSVAAKLKAEGGEELYVVTCFSDRDKFLQHVEMEG